jgi:diguanylate cyclase (GGDEF)-like protein/PAS domain S-box-containing protein
MSITSTGSSSAREAQLPSGASVAARGSALISLRVRLALAFGVLAGVLAGALSLVIGHYASGAARDQIGLYLTRLAVEYRDKLDLSLAERREEVAMLARLDVSLPDSAAPERRRARVEQLMYNPDFAWIGYIGANGRVEIASGKLLEGADVSERPWFRAARDKPVLLDAHEAVLLAKLLPPRAEPRRFIDIAVPLGGGRGVIGAHVDFAWAERLRNEIESQVRSDGAFDLMLAQGNGTVLIGPKPLLGTKVPLALGRRAGAPAAIEQWPDGEDYLIGGSAARNGLDWVVLARKRRVEAFAPVANLQQAILWAGVVLALGGIGAGWFLARRIAQPLESLSRAAASIAAGEHRTTLPRLYDNLEVARLSESLRAMLSHLREQSETLRNAQDHLELRVRERTAELVKLQAQLELEVADTMVARDDVATANERLALALEASHLALWDYDIERNEIYLGITWSQMLGGPAVETRITSRELLQLVPENERPRVLEAFQRAVSGESAEYRIEHPVARRDGSVMWIISTGRVVERGADGRPLRILGTNRDISERVQANAALRRSEARFKAAFDNPAVGVALVAPNGSFQATNRTMQRMLGYSEAEMLSTSFRALTHPDDLGENERLFDETLKGLRTSYEMEKRFLRKDGSPVWVQVNVALDRDELDLPLQFVCQVLDVTDRHEADARIKELALQDALTGLPNKRLLHDRLEQALALSRRERSSVGLLYLDLDGFKPVNDRLGHAAGDEVLVEIARRGRAVLRDSDTFARVGGDEFVVVLPGANRDAALRAAERLLAAIARPMKVTGGEAALGASIGAALAIAGEPGADVLQKSADAAMYEAKRSGRNRICIHEAKSKETPQ